MRRGTERKLGPAVKRLVDSIAPQTPLSMLERAWPRVVGEGLAAHSQPGSLRGGRLSVTCSSSVYSQELEMLSLKLLEALARECPEVPVETLRFSVGKVGS